MPTGELAPVAGTAMDFRSFKAIGKDADSDEPCVKPFRGYDVNFCLDGSVPAIEAKSLKSGIVMHVTTDQPGVQLFTANHMKERIGKNGQKYGHRSAFCLETQHFPDCIHHPDWPSCNSVGLPVEAIGIIMGIDRILDMARTAVNITGDAVCTTIVACQNGAVDKEVFNKAE